MFWVMVLDPSANLFAPTQAEAIRSYQHPTRMIQIHLEQVAVQERSNARIVNLEIQGWNASESSSEPM